MEVYGRGSRGVGAGLLNFVNAHFARFVSNIRMCLILD